ncbi:MAG: acetolactate decarboxylase [Kiritimatiellaceae bacterium]|nr:acetolactate decarboxylase [Kiritimatiellaceae bacterium]
MKQWIALLLLVLLAGCATAPRDTVVQVSTIDALLAGAYDGQVSLDDLLDCGDLGIGTFDALEGEMIMLDHHVYQARADGTVRQMPEDSSTPFASVVNFKPDMTLGLTDVLTKETFQTRVDGLAPNQNLFLAVRFDGYFTSMKVRSVPKQEKPYPPLAEAAEHQSVFEYTGVHGTVLGFRCPSFVKGVNVPGYHLHFISDDKTKGGHILDFTTVGGNLQLDACNRFYMILPDQNQLRALDLSKDRSAELEKIEK